MQAFHYGNAIAHETPYCKAKSQRGKHQTSDDIYTLSQQVSSWLITVDTIIKDFENI